MRSRILIIIFCSAFGLEAFGATDVWCSHIAAMDSWRTTLSVFNCDSTTSVFKLTKFQEDGFQIGNPIYQSISPASWFNVSPDNLNYNGYANVESERNLLVKVSYQYGSSQSICEFYLTSKTAKNWVIPNTVKSWFSYTGVALLNSTSEYIFITLDALKNGYIISSRTVNLPTKNRSAALSSSIWPGLNYSDFDTIRIHSSNPITAPISITGNNAQDRHVFFGAQIDSESSNELCGVWNGYWINNKMDSLNYTLTVYSQNGADFQALAYLTETTHTDCYCVYSVSGIFNRTNLTVSFIEFQIIGEVHEPGNQWCVPCSYSMSIDSTLTSMVGSYDCPSCVTGRAGLTKRAGF